MGLHVERLLTGSNVVHAAHRTRRRRATLDGELHELLEGLREGPDIREVATPSRLGCSLVFHARALAVLELHDGGRVDRRRNLLTKRGVDVRQRAILSLEDLEAIGLVLLDRRLDAHVRDERCTWNRVCSVGELRLVDRADLIGRAWQSELTHRVLLVATRREVGVAIVHTGTDLHLINREDVLHRKRGHHARLLKLRLHLLAERETRSHLGFEERRRLLLVEEGVLPGAGVGVKDAIGRTTVHGLGHRAPEEGHHVVVPLGRLDHSDLVRVVERQRAQEGLLGINLPLLLLTI